MADLRTRAGGLELSSPILAAAGPLTDSGDGLRACLLGGAAGVVARTVSTQPARAGRHVASGAPRGSLLTTETWSPRTVADHVARDYAALAGTDAPLIISLGHSAADVQALAPLVRPCAAAVEICTQHMADDPSAMAAAVRAAKAALAVPVWVKLTVLGRDVVAWAGAAQDAGADAVVAMGGFGPCLGIDAGSASVLFAESGGHAWLSGAAVKNIALRCVWDIARKLSIPVIGCGGVARGADAVEFLMAGASAVQVCTAAVLSGAQVFGKISRELNDWLDGHGYASVEALRGEAVRRMADRALRTEHVPPALDEEACIGCELCVTSCVYGALEMAGERKTPAYKVRLIAERCWGCGLCATRCPTRALRMAGVSLV